MLQRVSHSLARACAALALGLTAALAGQAQSVPNPALPQTAPGATEAAPDAVGPMRLRQSDRPGGAEWDPRADRTQRSETLAPPVYVPGEFEKFVQRQAGGVEVARFGAELVTGGFEGRGVELSPVVPADYVVAPGDEVLVTLWGSVDADLRLFVDRAGRISIPRVGTIQVSGVRYGDLRDAIQRRVEQVFKSFQLSVTLGQLRGIRVFVTGFATKPGAYNVTSLSTVLAALMRAGGPSSAGSFRTIELRRGPEVAAKIDLYDLLLKGDRSTDTTLQAGDVVHVGPVGTQIGFIGSVNRPAVMELKAGETVSDALAMAGGFTAIADRSRLAIERLQERSAGRIAQIDLPKDAQAPLSHGDVVRAFSAVEAQLPSKRQSKRVTIEGEVLRPGEYVLPENSSVRDALRVAGGFTEGAFVFATEFTRVTVQKTQQENYERALRDLETSFTRAASSQRVTSSEDASALGARTQSTSRLVDRLRALRPTGRVVLQIEPNATELPDLALEDGDRILIPARPTTVGVFGSVFNAATYLYTSGRSFDDYLRLAGGPTKGADESSIFVVRANGNVVSNRQGGGWFSRNSRLESLRVEPGDTVFVPEEMDKTTFVQAAKDWTQILYQFGLGIAGIVSATR